MSLRRWLAFVLVASAIAYAACSSGSSTSTTPDVPPPCTRCAFPPVPTKAIAPPPSCDFDEVAIPEDACSEHVCCAPKDSGASDG